MSLLTKRTAILVKTETTEGTDPTPAATDALFCEDISVKPVVVKHERPGQRASLSTNSTVTGARYYEITFRTEVKGSGAAGTAYAPLGAAIQACGFTEAVVVSTSVTYAPTSAPASASFQGPGKSCTIHCHIDGMKAVVVGCRGNMKAVINSGVVCYYEFTMRGIYAAVSDAAIPTTTYLAGNPPPAVSGSFTLAGLATAVASKIEFDMGNTLANRPSLSAATGYAGFLITNRAPVGSTDPEAVLVATHDFFGKLISGVEASTSVVVGATAGNITTFTAPKTQYMDLALGDREGVRTFEMGLKYNMNAGDDELTIVMT